MLQKYLLSVNQKLWKKITGGVANNSDFNCIFKSFNYCNEEKLHILCHFYGYDFDTLFSELDYMTLARVSHRSGHN